VNVLDRADPGSHWRSQNSPPGPPEAGPGAIKHRPPKLAEMAAASLPCSIWEAWSVWAS